VTLTVGKLARPVLLPTLCQQWHLPNESRSPSSATSLYLVVRVSGGTKELTGEWKPIAR
jgi:hypothetical protein